MIYDMIFSQNLNKYDWILINYFIMMGMLFGWMFFKALREYCFENSDEGRVYAKKKLRESITRYELDHKIELQERARNKELGPRDAVTKVSLF